MKLRNFLTNLNFTAKNYQDITCTFISLLYMFIFWVDQLTLGTDKKLQSFETFTFHCFLSPTQRLKVIFKEFVSFKPVNLSSKRYPLYPFPFSYFLFFTYANSNLDMERVVDILSKKAFATLVVLNIFFLFYFFISIILTTQQNLRWLIYAQMLTFKKLSKIYEKSGLDNYVIRRSKRPLS